MKKIPILLYCAHGELLSEMSFVLRVNSYDVIAVTDSSAAVSACLRNKLACGLLVHTGQGDPAGRLIHRILNHNADVPLLLVDLVGDLAPVRYVDLVLYGRNTRTAHILAALQALVSKPTPRSAA